MESTRSAHGDGSVPGTTSATDPPELEQLEKALVSAHQTMAAAFGDLLEQVAVLDETELHRSTYADAASWLAFNFGLRPNIARSWVRTARLLSESAGFAAAFNQGRLSLDQLQTLTPVHGSKPDTELLELCQTSNSIDDLNARVRQLIETPPTKPTTRAPTGLFTRWVDDRLHLHGEIAGADGVVVESALLRLAALAPKDEQTGIYRDPATRTGEALVQMASESLAADTDHDRATIVVHIHAQDLADGRGPGWDAANRLFTTDDLQRLLCDSRLQPAIDDPTGVTIGVGRTTRSIAPWLRRIVEGRDQGCRFPGCRRTRWLHCHHQTPWSQGGATNLDNLLSLCGFHHRLIHQGWTITGNPNTKLSFTNQWGHPHLPAPQRFPPGWTDLVLEGIDRKARIQLAEMANSPP